MQEQIGAEQMRALGAEIKYRLPAGLGFCLIIYPFNQPGYGNYISSGNREDMIKALRETADRLESMQDFKTPTGN